MNNISKSDNADVAVSFLRLIETGQIDRAYQLFVTSSYGTHHNLFTKSGFRKLNEGMKQAHESLPEMKLEIKHVLSDGELVAVHSQIIQKPGDKNLTAVHLFRFKDSKIVELWDIAQEIPKDSPNSDGAF